MKRLFGDAFPKARHPTLIADDIKIAKIHIENIEVFMATGRYDYCETLSIETQRIFERLSKDFILTNEGIRNRRRK